MRLALDVENAEEMGRASSPAGWNGGGLPSEFLEWLSDSRSALFDAMASRGAAAIRTQPSHLAVMATLDEGGTIDLATKGLGPLPRPELLDEVTAAFERSCQVPDMEDRIATARAFYSDPRRFDPLLLGGLEIFEGRTYSNVLRGSSASLLFTGDPPKYLSYQLDGPVTLLGPGDPHYEFLVKAREMFALEPFHLVQRAYPAGYLFRPTSVRVKTPFPRR